VFAGEFQSFDAVLMINTPDGYTLILGGIGLLYASEGQSVLAGEPVGALPDGETARLYFEIRRNSDQAEDPEQWLRPEHRQG
jgi:murein hydrolase activator